MNDTSPDLIYKKINRKRRIVFIIALAATVVAFLLDICVGSSGMSPIGVIETLIAGPNGDEVNTLIIWSIRLPMTVTSVPLPVCRFRQ